MINGCLLQTIDLQLQSAVRTRRSELHAWQRHLLPSNISAQNQTWDIATSFGRHSHWIPDTILVCTHWSSRFLKNLLPKELLTPATWGRWSPGPWSNFRSFSYIFNIFPIKSVVSVTSLAPYGMIPEASAKQLGKKGHCCISALCFYLL